MANDLIASLQAAQAGQSKSAVDAHTPEFSGETT